MEFTAKIKDAEVKYSNDACDKIMKFIHNNEGADFVIKYEPIKDIKSYEQLKFYFGVLLPAFTEATGETDRTKLDAYFRDKYLSSIHEINGEQFKFIPSLQIGKNQVNKEKMIWYIEQVLNELFDCGGSLPVEKVNDYRNAML